MKNFKLLPTVAATGLVAALSTGTAQALPSISGEFSFFGSGDMYLADTTTAANMMDVEFLDFGGNGAGVNGIVSTSNTASGTFLTEGLGDVSFADFGEIADLHLTTPPFTPLDPFLNFQDFNADGDDFTVELLTVSINQSTRSLTNLDITGTAVLRMTGYEDTVGQWSLNSTVSNGNEFTFTASNQQSISSVPEPSAAALLGLGLVGLAIGRRRLAKK